MLWLNDKENDFYGLITNNNKWYDLIIRKMIFVDYSHVRLRRGQSQQSFCNSVYSSLSNFRSFFHTQGDGPNPAQLHPSRRPKASRSRNRNRSESTVHHSTLFHYSWLIRRRSFRLVGPNVVVFLHGFPEIWYSWRHQMIALATAGFRAIAPDYRGYGLSDPPPEPENATFVDLLSDLLGILDALGLSKVLDTFVNFLLVWRECSKIWCDKLNYA